MQYASFVGTLRSLADKPLLDLSSAEVKRFDIDIVRGRAGVYRAVLRMFYNANERDDLLRALPKFRKRKERRAAFETIIMPDDAASMIAAADSLRDRAILAVLYAGGARINEILTLKIRDVNRVNGGYQMFFGKSKARGQERYSPKIESVWKRHLDAWLDAHPFGSNADAYLFTSTENVDTHVSDGTINALLHALAKKAGITKQVNAHWWRHSRISLAFACHEADLGTICTWFWGIPVTPMANRYSHYSGLEMTIETPKPVELRAVPALPVSMTFQTRKDVIDLTAKVEQLETERRDIMKMFREIIDTMPKQIRDAVDAKDREAKELS